MSTVGTLHVFSQHSLLGCIVSLAIKVTLDPTINCDRHIQTLKDRLAVLFQNKIVNAGRQCPQGAATFRIELPFALQAGGEVVCDDGVTGRHSAGNLACDGLCVDSSGSFYSKNSEDERHR
jgi:hypothetical protein